jgi:hypothetical protein
MSSTIALKPDPLTFGTVCEGFVYRIRVLLSNHGPAMDRFRVVTSADNECDPNTITCDYKIKNVAPGVGTYFTLELRAVESFQSTYALLITRGSTKQTETLTINAQVIPKDIFKRIARSLMIRNKGIYSQGVVCAGAIVGEGGGPSVTSGAPTIYSEALIDDDELDELVELPILQQNYWDPYKKQLCVDEDLCRVITDPTWSTEKSMSETEKFW